jgi:tetratricopeptide (TPR) repeat protein
VLFLEEGIARFGAGDIQGAIGAWRRAVKSTPPSPKPGSISATPRTPAAAPRWRRPTGGRWRCGRTSSKPGTISATPAFISARDPAFEAYERAIALRRDVYESWFNLATARADLGEYDEAIRCYGRALVLRPDAHETWFNLGFARAARGCRRAIGAYTRAAALHENDYEIWYNLGSACSTWAGWRRSSARFGVPPLCTAPTRTWNNLECARASRGDRRSDRRFPAGAHPGSGLRHELEQSRQRPPGNGSLEGARVAYERAVALAPITRPTA